MPGLKYVRYILATHFSFINTNWCHNTNVAVHLYTWVLWVHIWPSVAYIADLDLLL